MKYVPHDYFDTENPLDLGFALVQAARTLDQLVQLAVDQKDADALLNAAAMWVKIAEALSPDGGGTEEGDVSSIRMETPPMGFVGREEDEEDG